MYAFAARDFMGCKSKWNEYEIIIYSLNNVYLRFNLHNMNKLVIVGNGFDLAHGLPTGYCSFIDNVWSEISKNPLSYEYLVNINSNYILNLNNINSYTDFRNCLEQYKLDSSGHYKSIQWRKYKSQNAFFEVQNYNGIIDKIFEFKNAFFELISTKNYIQNWVDIENEYYKLLKDCLNEQDNEKVKKLNKEFNEIKNLLEDYLNTNVNNSFDFEQLDSKSGELLNHFLLRPKGLEIDENYPYLKEFPKEDTKYLVDFDKKISESYRSHTLQRELYNSNIIQNNFILNFNYT